MLKQSVVKLKNKAAYIRSRRKWRSFQKLHKNLLKLGTPDLALKEGCAETHEAYLIAVTSKPEVNTFLEIGIGPKMQESRMRLMSENGKYYFGCDFADVCSLHQNAINFTSIDQSKIKYLPNKTGTYAWTLMELMQAGKQFDAIYLDGHHTFYVDAPAFIIADQLLKPGGFFLIDDIRWTLSLLIQNMARNHHEWQFYHKMYDLTQYTSEQQLMPHIGMIAQLLLIDRLGYKRVDTLSTQDWWTLRKPSTSQEIISNLGNCQ